MAAILACGYVLLSAQSGARQAGPALKPLHELESGEGVFAYSRISPDGRFLAYASELQRQRGSPIRTIKVIDLTRGTLTFSEPGIDAYWSPDGTRIIFLSYREPTRPAVAIWNMDTRATTRRIAPTALGDYYSWALRDAQDLILTIRGRYFYLDGTQARLPAGSIVSCPGIGTGDRPLISKDGRRVTVFVDGRLVVRNLTDCDDIIETGVLAAKADFSWDGRYVAYHAPKLDASGYEIQVLDPERRTVRRVTDLPGSSFFPSWTADGRLSFRYDSEDYHGFLMASDVLAAEELPLASVTNGLEQRVAWEDLFLDSLPAPRIAVVLVWATWSAHSSDALLALHQFASDWPGVAVGTAVDIGSRRGDVVRVRSAFDVRLPELAVRPSLGWSARTAAQMPTTLMFVDGALEDERLGAQTREELSTWVQQFTASVESPRAQRSRGRVLVAPMTTGRPASFRQAYRPGS